MRRRRWPRAKPRERSSVENERERERERANERERERDQFANSTRCSMEVNGRSRVALPFDMGFLYYPFQPLARHLDRGGRNDRARPLHRAVSSFLPFFLFLIRNCFLSRSYTLFCCVDVASSRVVDISECEPAQCDAENVNFENASSRSSICSALGEVSMSIESSYGAR